MRQKLFLVMVGLALTMLGGVRGSYAGGIPLSQLSGAWSARATGYVNFCYSTATFQFEDCTAADAGVAVQDFAAVNNLVWDASGHFCATSVQLIGGATGDPNPTGSLIALISGHTTKYDPASGTGDLSDTNYAGGKCVGASFVSDGSPATALETDHFVLSEGGNRADLVITSITSAVTAGSPNFFGYATVSAELHRLNPSHNQR